MLCFASSSALFTAAEMSSYGTWVDIFLIVEGEVIAVNGEFARIVDEEEDEAVATDTADEEEEDETVDEVEEAEDEEETEE